MWSTVRSQLAELLKGRVYTVLLQDLKYVGFLQNTPLKPPYFQYASGIPNEFRKKYDLVCEETAANISRELENKHCLNPASSRIPLKAIELGKAARLYRVAGAASQAVGGWWFEEELLTRLVEECKSSGYDYRLCVLAKLRNRLAISQDWNFVSQIWQMKLPAGIRVPVVTGEGLPQPAISADSMKKWKISGEFLKKYDNQGWAGGEIQIWFPWMPNAMISDYMQLPG
jgi:hypothetical protein